VTYLDVEDVLDFYADLFGLSRQQAADHLRDRSRLEAALARPRQYAYYQAADLAQQAAALAHGIAEGQPFVDGNKRVTLVALRSFLLANGFQVTATQEERAAWVLDLHAGLSVDELADRIRSALVELD
jgi:death-on-curing protein